LDMGLNVEKSFRMSVKQLSPMVETAEKYKVVLGLENMPAFDCQTRMYSIIPEEHCYLVDSFKSEYVKAVWDFGHAHLRDFPQEKAIEQLGSRIAGTHIHNNYKCNDDHFAPSKGTIDWTKIIPSLNKTGYMGYLTLESSYPKNNGDEIERIFAGLYKDISEISDIFDKD